MRTGPTDRELTELQARWMLAQTEMGADSTPATRSAYRAVALAYNSALDLAEHDVERVW